MKFITLFAIALLSLMLQACLSKTEAQCTCEASFSFTAHAVNNLGDTLAMDSLGYWYNDTSLVSVTDSAKLRLGSFGSGFGSYRVWAYHDGIVSDTAEFSMQYTNVTDGCKTLVSQNITFTFLASTPATPTMAKTSTCGGSN